MTEDQLKQYNIIAAFPTEVLSDSVKYLNEINSNIIFQFYKDKILIQLSDSKNIQYTEHIKYTELTINSGHLSDYDPGISDENQCKILGIEAEGILNKINGLLPNVEKDATTIIKIDSIIERKIEFDLPNDVVICSKIYDVPERTLNVLKAIHANIEKMRSDTLIECASAEIEPTTFNKICKFRGNGNVHDTDNKMLLTLDKKGLHVKTGDPYEGGGTHFELINKGDNTPEADSETEFLTLDDIEHSRLDLENYIENSNSPDIKPTEQLYNLKVNNPQSVLLEIDYLNPFTLLSDIDDRPILIEIRQDYPLILQKVGSEEFLIDVLLVIGEVGRLY